ncbi:MAG TPA: TRAP transporter substrate-binding protein [Alphaproteobacteria bacterium]|nr:TRAP transporter substrate-binding protein [Alphaproteobacteria bacterium]
MTHYAWVRSVPGALVAGILLASSAAPAQVPEITLRVHHFLPASSTAQAQLIEPWAEALAEQTEGRIAVEIYPAMQLGGVPASLYDQVRDGVVDVVWTLPGYTPGRFPLTEVFELPFMAASAEATSQAVQEFYGRHLTDEYDDVHVLMLHVHAPGSLHINGQPVETMDDLQGMRVRAPIRVVESALEQLGAVPVDMPVPQVPDALSRGVVDAAVIPWEVALPLRVHELVDHHTEFGGDRGLYTAVFLFAMNKDTYESLPDDLKQVIDANSGLALARKTGAIYDEAEAPGRQAAVDAGNAINTLGPEAVARWRQALQPVTDAWVARAGELGKDGAALLQEARDLVAKYEGR